MKLQDLKSGMIVKTRRGETGLIIKDNCYGKDAVIFSKNSWTELNGFDNDTLEWNLNDRVPCTLEHCKSVDIMKVYKPDLPTGFLKRESKFTESMTLVWERLDEEEIKEFTMEELTDELGYPFKIIK